MTNASDHFKSDRTSSNRAGVTLMNNQVGYVVAEVMRGKSGVTVEVLPSMIRIDGKTSSRSTTRSAPRRSAGRTSATTTSRRSCRPTTGAWSYSTIGSSCSPTPRTPLSTSASTSKRSARAEGERYVRAQWREVLHRRRPPPLLGRQPRNWVKGQEEYAKGWIECFHAYQGLGPESTHWPIEKFQKYTEEDFVKDVFEDGGVDVGIFQSTYLKEWYSTGFNTAQVNAKLAEKHTGRLIVNGRFDPREGDAGLKQLEEDAKRYNLQGVKLYTAEWHEGSRGWTLADEECKPFFEKCKELGIKNLHVHKGPTIWPLDKDAFDPKDVDIAATSNTELNFIIEHVGLPRIEDFCFMATQEPNVYAGLSVVIGGLMHARPRFFAKVMGELLFWVGEDKMLFGSDYAIWEPKWQIEGLLNWDYPDEEYSDYPRVDDAGKRKILGPQRGPAIRDQRARGVTPPGRVRNTGREGGRAAGRVGMTRRPSASSRRSRQRSRPGAGRADHQASVRQLMRREP